MKMRIIFGVGVAVALATAVVLGQPRVMTARAQQSAVTVEPGPPFVTEGVETVPLSSAPQEPVKSPDTPPNPDAEVLSPPVDDLGPPVPVSPNQNLPSRPGITAPAVPLDFSQDEPQSAD